MNQHKAELIILSLFTLALLASCQSSQPNQVTIERAEPTSVVTAAPTITADVCEQQPRIDDGVENFPLTESLIQFERIPNFINTLALNVTILETSKELATKEFYNFHALVAVTFTNLTEEDIIIQEPIGISVHDFPYHLKAIVENADGERLPLQGLHVNSPYIPGKEDFVQIASGKNHCIQQNFFLFITLADEAIIDGKTVDLTSNLKPGKYHLSLLYSNLQTGYDNHDLNAWVGELESNTIVFEIP